MSQNFNKGVVDRFPNIMDTVKRVNGGKIPGQVLYVLKNLQTELN